MWKIVFLFAFYLNLLNCERNGLARLNVSWTYNNPESRFENGQTCAVRRQTGCNVHFQLCIWGEPRKLSKSCNIFQGTTSEYMHVVNVTDQISLRIPQPAPRAYGFLIQVIGRVDRGLFRRIASFEAHRFTVPPNGNWTRISLNRTNSRMKNPTVEMRTSFQLRCGQHFYGRYCQNYCKPNTSHYICGPEGERICRHGLRGPLCLKKDWCAFYPCPPYTMCVLNSNEDGRLCVCKSFEGPECRTNVTMCNSGSCDNGRAVTTITEQPFNSKQSSHRPTTDTTMSTMSKGKTEQPNFSLTSPETAVETTTSILTTELEIENSTQEHNAPAIDTDAVVNTAAKTLVHDSGKQDPHSFRCEALAALLMVCILLFILLFIYWRKRKSWSPGKKNTTVTDQQFLEVVLTSASKRISTSQEQLIMAALATINPEPA